MLLTGLGGPKDEAAALVLLQDAAAAGVPSAQVNLGKMLENGGATQRNLPAAISWYEKAADQGSIDARLRLMDLYYFGTESMAPDFAKALPHVKAAAAAGNATAQNLLGTMFEFGQAVEPSHADALHWFREAAMQGDAKAQSNLGRLIRQHSTGEAEMLEAYQWIRLSAEQGEITAKVILADFEKGFSAAQKELAAEWIAEFRQKHPDATRKYRRKALILSGFHDVTRL